jgi:hypothetical protein
MPFRKQQLLKVPSVGDAEGREFPAYTSWRPVYTAFSVQPGGKFSRKQRLTAALRLIMCEVVVKCETPCIANQSKIRNEVKKA